ncbi:MAG TPA: sigma-70 family RNA polymerase sigma factor [Pirellulales bacterium]|jgi:RNA polymerase sigma-70 factor (ECF subfamily)|nr:sigma-70 family RNA polymerase sigma factor [Pirellulales bacterium]
MADADESRTSTTLLRDLNDFANQEAWRTFLIKYQPRIEAWCRGMGLKNVDDVTGEVLLRITQRIRSFVYDPRQSFRAYLHTIVANAVRDSFRKQRQPGAGATGGSVLKNALDQIEGHDGVAEWIDELESDLEPAQQLAQRAVAIVQRQVAPNHWQAFWLTAIEKQKGAEVAAKLEMTVAAVHQAKCRVLKKLKETVTELQS